MGVRGGATFFLLPSFISFIFLSFCFFFPFDFLTCQMFPRLAVVLAVVLALVPCSVGLLVLSGEFDHLHGSNNKEK